MDLDLEGAIPLGARNMDEHDSSRARSTAPNGRRQGFNTAAALHCSRLWLLAAAKLLPKSALSLHPELAHIAECGYEGVRLQFKGEK
jgi:hypothetical protein